MTFEVTLVQIGLGILLFFLINWIGKHSYSIGYISISVFARVEEAPAFNFLLRILTPLVYLIITAALFYSVGLDRFVNNFYLVNLYYVTFRLLFNLVTGRGLLLNWFRQILYWISILLGSYFIYANLIITKENILPDFTTLANELWIIIIVFLFHVFNNVRTSHKKTQDRKYHYIKKTISRFQKKYGTIINERVENEKLRALVYSIMLLENFNRPRLIRWLEYASFFLTKRPHSMGIMQVISTTYISDKKSIILGIEKIIGKYHHFLNEIKDRRERHYYSGDFTFVMELASSYNTSANYNSDIHEMFEIVLEVFYPETGDSFLPHERVDKISGDDDFTC